MSLIPLNFLPGIQRDGTPFDSNSAIDGLWCRWRLGRPRKMGGFYRTYANIQGITRKVYMFYQGNQTIIHVGTGKSLEQIVIDNNGNFVSYADRTPAIFAAGPDAGWTMDALFDTTSTAVTLIAHSTPDISTVASTTQTIPFIGDITKIDKLKPLTNPTTTDGVYNNPKIAGGIVCAQPYLFDFDINGFIGWSAPNLPNTLGVSGGTSGAGNARVSAQKIVAGMAQRGGGVNSPAALFWSLSEVITAQFVGSPAVFAFNTVSPSSSILSQNSVIEYDGLYCWAGIDRFLMYNGTVVEIPNTHNQDWFFNNLNRQYAGKAFAFKVPRYGEIWFCAPMFGNTECSHAAIWNVRENTWYDTELPNGGRSAGYFAQGFPFPIMTGSTKGSNGYSLWVHETGTDQTGPKEAPTPIRSYYETPYIGSAAGQQPDPRATSFQQLEADIIQSGDMTVYTKGTFNARGGLFQGKPVNLQGIPKTNQDQLVGFSEEYRLGSLHFESNTLNGTYITGKNILHTQTGGERVTGGVGGLPIYPKYLVSDSLQALLADDGAPLTEDTP